MRKQPPGKGIYLASEKARQCGTPVAMYICRRGNMTLRGHKGDGQGALVRESFVVMVSRDGEEVRHVAGLLQGRAACALMAFETAEELVQNVPRGRPAVAILADAGAAGHAEQALLWLNRRWPRCTSVVVNDQTDKRLEMAVRRAGAIFMIRPVSGAEWQAILDCGLRRSGATTSLTELA